METLKITKNDNKNGRYTTEAVNFEGHIEIAADLGWVSFTSLKATGHISAKACTGIEASEGIEAGEGIKAGEGISVGLRIFAGLIMWRKPRPEEMEIKCQRLLSGEVAYGNLIEVTKD